VSLEKRLGGRINRKFFPIFFQVLDLPLFISNDKKIPSFTSLLNNRQYSKNIIKSKHLLSENGFYRVYVFYLKRKKIAEFWKTGYFFPKY
jgi:hypothetical protein